MDIFLKQVIIYLCAAIIAVPIAKRLGLSSVLGYLLAGIIIGPFGFAWINNVDTVFQFAEFGVVMLLFLVGLELNPRRLWQMRRLIFGVGSTQILITVTAIFIIGKLFMLPSLLVFIAAIGFAMSSTAIALQSLAEKKRLNTAAGQVSFSVLLFQDIAVIPLMLLLSLIAPTHNIATTFSWLGLLRAILLIAAFTVIVKYFLRYLLRFIANTSLREIFIAFSLLLVIGAALLMRSIGLSMAFGTFLAGVLLADSEYRHQLELDIEPFKGLLLGLFFIAVGMSVKLDIFIKQPVLIIAITLGLVLVKIILLYFIAKIFRETNRDAQLFAVTLSQVGEFAFVLFSVAFSENLLTATQMQWLNAVVACSMLSTPLILLLYEKVIMPRFNQAEIREPDTIEEHNAVIMGGFGRMGSVIGRLLQGKDIKTTVIDFDANQIELVRRYGYKAYYGDISQLDMLKIAGAAEAKLLILAIDDMQAIQRTIELVQTHFPKLKLIVRARGRTDAYIPLEMGVPVVRETFGSALMMSEEALIMLGYEPYLAKRIIQKFRLYDEAHLNEAVKVRDNDKQLLSLAQQGREALTQLLNEEGLEKKDYDSGWN